MSPEHVELPAPPRLTMGAFQIIVLGLAISLTWYLTKKLSIPTQAYSETATAQLEKLTAEVTQLKGNLLSQGELEKKIRKEMGSDFAKAIDKQNGTITTLAVAVGKIPGATADLIPPADFTILPGGGFKNVNLEQNRTPALTSVNLSYDPSHPNGLTGKWFSYTEKFNVKFGEWRTEHDGIRTAVKLNREVYDGERKVGEELIPIVDGDAYVSTDAVNRTVPQPKFTFHIGTSYDAKTGKPRPAGLIGKQITDKSAVTTGWVNNAWTVLYSYRFGAK